MRSTVRLLRLVSAICLPGAILAAGCGGGGGSIISQQPVAVSLPISTVVVSQDGMQIIVPINITSTSETALVSFSGLPGGVQVKYSASDTNPSGSLAFTASASATQGTYTPTVIVNSAGQAASTSFTLVITAGSQMGTISGPEKSATPEGVAEWDGKGEGISQKVSFPLS
jgi:hypothetical protein